MPSTYSPSLKIQLIAVGDETNQWGSITNTNFQYALEQGITGYSDATFPVDANYAWGAGYVNSNGAQEQRNLVIRVLGTISATREFIVPTIEKQYIIFNNTVGGQAILVKTSAGSGVTIPNGLRMHVFVDGTDVVQMDNYDITRTIGSLTLTTALPIASGGTGAANAPAARTNLGLAIGTDIPSPTGTGASGTWGIDITGNAATATTATTSGNVTGTVAVANGGTGATTAPNARTNLGLIIGTDIPSPTGTGASGNWAINVTGTSANVTGTVAIANGGTGAATAQLAINALAGATTAGQYLRGNGTNIVMSAIQAADVPTLNQSTTGSAASVSVTGQTGLLTFLGLTSTNRAKTVRDAADTILELGGSYTPSGTWNWTTATATWPTFNQNTTGTAANVTGTVAIANGGTGATTQQAAMTALAGANTAGQYLRGNGTNVVMSAIQAGDVPTLNQNTTGTALNVTGTVAIVNGGTGQTSANAALNALLPVQTANNGKYLTTNGFDTSWATIPTGGVTTFSAGTTGLTPATATSGAVTLGGTLAVANGGTGVTSSTGSGDNVLGTSPTITDPKIAQSINTQTGTSYTAVLADSNKVITLSNSLAITFTIPLNASVAFPIGTSLNVAQLGAGQVTIAGAGGVTIFGIGTKIAAQYGAATALQIATNQWLLVGNLTT